MKNDRLVQQDRQGDVRRGEGDGRRLGDADHRPLVGQHGDRRGEHVGRGLAGRIGDADTADLFTGLSRETDKYLWFLEAHLHAQR